MNDNGDATWRADLGQPPAPLHYSKPKLTPKQRAEIRQRYADGETAASLAAEYKVSTLTIRNNSDARDARGHR